MLSEVQARQQIGHIFLFLAVRELVFSHNRKMVQVLGMLQVDGKSLIETIWYNRYTETWTEEGYYQKIFYNSNWDVTRIATQDKTLEFREYDIEHNMTAMVDGRGNRTEYRYDDERNLVALINPLGETWVYEYEPVLNRKVAEIDPKGTVSIFRYNSEGQLEKAVAATEQLASPVTFDGNGLPVYDLRVSFDGNGDLVDDNTPAANVLLDYPERGEIRFTYDSFGNQLTQTQVIMPAQGQDPEEVIETENVYDIYGLNRVKSIDARDNETEYFYDDLSRVVAVKDRAGYVTQAEYTDFDAVKKTVAADSAVTEYFYDENRRLVRTLLPNKGEVKTIYGSPFYVDHVDRVLHTIDPLGYYVSHEYDKAGRGVLTKDKNGNISRFKYDEENRLIETINAVGDSMHYAYDGNGNRISITDYRGNTVRCEFDEANRKVLQRETWGDERAVAYEYDLNGNRTAVSRGTMSGDTFVPLDRTEITFDARNHVTRTVRNAGEDDRRITWTTFDSIGRVTETIEGGYDSGTSTVYGIRRSVSVFDENSNVTDSFIYGWDDVAGDWFTSPIQSTSSQYDVRNLVSQSTDPNGTPTTYTYDPVGRVLTTTTNITDPNSISVPHITDCTFDIMGNKVLVKSIVGTTEVSRDEYGYNLRNERVRHEDALGNIRSVVFDGNGNATESTDPAGNITRTYFDALNRVSANENALGQTTRREYDPNSNLIAAISPLNERTIYEYNENNERISTTDPVGNKRHCVFDKRGRKVFDVDPRFDYETTPLPTVASAPLLYTTKYHNNDFNEVYETFAPVTLADDTVVTVQASVVFDAVGRAIETTDARGTVTQQDFDALDRVTEIRQAFGTVDETVTRNYFDLNSNLLLSIRAVGTPEEIATYTRFDEANRAIESTIGELQASFDPTTLDPSTDTPASIFEANEFLTSTIDYFDALRKVESTDPYGMSASTVTDALGRTTSATDKAGYVTTFNYDSRNNLIQTNFPVGSPDAPIINTYDKLNRVVSTTQAGDTTSRKFDASLRLIEEKDARGYITRHVYDKASRLIRTTRAVGTPEQAISKLEYDAANNRIAIIDANHSLAYAAEVTANEIPIATYEYDELNRVAREWDASWAESSAPDAEMIYIYDNEGLPIATRKRDGLLIERTFDALGRLTKVATFYDDDSDLDYAEEPEVIQQEFVYDDLSRMTDTTDYNAGFVTGVSNAEHTVSYDYDFASRVTDETIYDSDLHNPIAGRTVSTTWGIASASGLSQQITKNYPYGSRGQIRKLDERGQLRFIENLSSTQIASFDYDSMRRPDDYEVRNSSSVQVMTGSATFDSRGREQNRVLEKSGTQFLNLATNYDASSNVDDETFAGTLPIVTGFKDYSNDPLNRLTAQDNPVGTDDLSWTLDLEGNWLSTNQNGSVENRTVNADNEFDDIGSTVVDYDSNGNIVRYGDLAFSFDWAERMTEVRDVSGGLPGIVVATYSYDAANRRIKRTYNGVTTTYVYDGSQVVQELENSIFARTFVYGSYVDAPVVMYDEANSGAQYFYARDRRANIVGLLDSNSNVVERYEYSPFGTWTVYNAAGVELTAGTAYGNPYGFTGRRWDFESGLWYYRNRMYSAELGRFLSRDPAGFIDGWNVYGYVRNNPMIYVDPYGNVAWFGPMAVGGLIGGGVGAGAGALAAWWSGGDTEQIIAGALGGAVGGFITGSGMGLIGVGATAGVTTIGSAVGGVFTAGAGGAVIGNTVTQVSDHMLHGQSFGQSLTNVDMQQQAFSGLVGGTVNVAVWGAGTMLSRATEESVSVGLERGAQYVDDLILGSRLPQSYIDDAADDILTRLIIKDAVGESIEGGLERGSQYIDDLIIGGRLGQSQINTAANGVLSGLIRQEAIGLTAASVTLNPLVGAAIDLNVGPRAQSLLDTANSYLDSLGQTGTGINAQQGGLGTALSGSLASLVGTHDFTVSNVNGVNSEFVTINGIQQGANGSVGYESIEAGASSGSFNDGIIGYNFNSTEINSEGVGHYNFNSTLGLDPARDDFGFRITSTTSVQSHDGSFSATETIDGGQSASFIDRSRLISHHGASLRGRSTFMNRNSVPRPQSLSRGLFR